MIEKVPVCSKCEARADSSFATYRLNVSGTNAMLNTILIYCTKCGTVQGIVRE